MIVVVEAEDSEPLLHSIESVCNVEGGLAVSLVYHQQEEQGEEAPGNAVVVALRNLTPLGQLRRQPVSACRALP
ncbi:hypothetical protein JQN47_27720, partial [Escherichia coli]|nr:hypothetical protein [Escherichia coli]